MFLHHDFSLWGSIKEKAAHGDPFMLLWLKIHDNQFPHWRSLTPSNTVLMIQCSYFQPEKGFMPVFIDSP
ncbi:hypothetical protein EIT96_14280 [Salmonella enterica subsp. enterica serovar Colindale]|nr:hypothetical protein [Salmonella enterica subsp. enterica]